MENNDNNKSNNFFDYREYNIKIDNNAYNLRLEINEKYIYFILFNLNESLEYIYKNKMDLSTIINKLELNPSKYSNSEIILKIFDDKKNQISINVVNDNFYKILIKSLNEFEEEITTEIKLNKEFMNDNDKFKYIFSILKLIMKNNNKIGEKREMENIKNKINELNTNINKKDTIIQKLNEKIFNQENIIKKINDNNDIINKKYEELENNLNEKINNIKNNLINDLNNQNNKINKMMNDKIEIMKIKYDEFVINNNKKNQNEEFDNKINNLINNKIKEKEENIKNKLYEDTKEINNKINEINNKNEERIMNIIIK